MYFMPSEIQAQDKEHSTEASPPSPCKLDKPNIYNYVVAHLSWSRKGDRYRTGDTYRVQISTSITGFSPETGFPSPLKDVTITRHSFKFRGTSRRSYYYTVQAYDAVRGFSKFATPIRFTLKPLY